MKKSVNKVEAKYTLLTNLSFIQREGDNLRISCHVLLITEDEDNVFGRPSYTIRGFGTEAAWDTFSLWLDKDTQLPFTLQTAEDKSVVMAVEDKLVPIFRGNMLTLKDGTQFFLQTDNNSRPIDIYKQEGDICRVWDIMFEKTAEYWHAPYMPRLTFGPPSKIGNRYKSL